MDRRSALRISVIYATFAALWIVVSSGIPLLQGTAPISSGLFELFKGLAFVLVTTFFLFWLMLRLGHAEEARYRALFHSNPNPMWVYDLETLGILDVNDTAVARYGYSRAEFLAMTIKDLRPSEDIPRLLDNISHLAADGVDNAGIWRHIRKDRSVIDVEITSHIVSYAGRRAEMVLAIDVTDRLRALAQLSESEQRYRALTEQTISGVFTLEDGRIGFTNARIEEIFGFQRDELKGQSLRILVSPEDWPHAEEAVARLTSREVPSLRLEINCIRKDGVKILISSHAALATISGKSVILGMLQDISEARRAEDTIRDYATRLETTLLGTLNIITRLIELRDPYTSGHQKNVGDIAAAIAAEMGLPEFLQNGLKVAGAVHDVGKIMVPAEILTKPGRLTANEYALVKEHAEQGYEVLKAVKFPWPVAEVAGQHHERLDGSGYPKGLKGDEIILEARIVAVADVMESMAGHRPYRPALGIDKALAEIEANAGRLYDAEVVAACSRLFRERGYHI